METRNNNLRQEAESRLNDRLKDVNVRLSEADMLKLIHELEVHQIELEMQHEELLLAWSQAKDAKDKYTELYDFAPFGYFTVSREGTIIESNLSGATMLGSDRESLKNSKLSVFLAKESVPVFNEFLQNVYSSDTGQSCEILLSVDDKPPVHVQSNSFIPENSENCWISMVDITEKKQIQRKLLNAILIAEEKEKIKFSTELHESLGPLLSTIVLYLSSLDAGDLTEKQKRLISMSNELLNEAVSQIKEISARLSPYILIQFGLNVAIKDFISKVNEFSEVIIEFSSNTESRFDSNLELILFRTTAEFINSTIKYANAKNIRIHLIESSNQISLEYNDDGIGFDLEEIFKKNKDMSLVNIGNRIKSFNGSLTIDSKPGQGVNYEVAIKVSK